MATASPRGASARTASPTASARYAAAWASAGPPDPVGELTGSEVQQHPEAGHGEGDAGRSAEPRERRQRAVGLAEGQACPREAAERRGAPRPLLQHPGQGHGGIREGAKARVEQRALRHGQDGAHGGEVQGLQGAQRDPWQVADVDTGPRQGRQEEAEAVGEADQEGQPPAGAEHRGGQQCHPDRRQPPDVVLGEGVGGEEAGSHSSDEAHSRAEGEGRLRHGTTVGHGTARAAVGTSKGSTGCRQPAVVY